MPFVVEIELKGARLRGHDHFWSTILKTGAKGTFTLLDIVEATNAHKATVNDFIQRLVRGEYLGVAGWQGEGRFRQKTYALLKKSPATPSLRRDGTAGHYGRGRQQMWNVLRSPSALGGIVADDVAMLAATDEIEISAASAAEYLRLLHRAGYLRLRLTAGRSRTQHYQLIRDTGPLAPKVLKTLVVYDQNQRVLFDTTTAEEVA